MGMALYSWVTKDLGSQAKIQFEVKCTNSPAFASSINPLFVDYDWIRRNRMRD